MRAPSLSLITENSEFSPFSFHESRPTPHTVQRSSSARHSLLPDANRIKSESYLFRLCAAVAVRPRLFRISLALGSWVTLWNLCSRAEADSNAHACRREAGAGGEENNCKVWPFLFMLCLETILIELSPNCSKCRAERINAGQSERVDVQRNKNIRECARINCKELAPNTCRR